GGGGSGGEVGAGVRAASRARVGTILVTVQSGGLTSNELAVRVVPPGLPPAPTLTSIEPAKTAAGSDSTWVTLRGSGFIEGDSLVKAETSLDIVASEYVSPEELRAQVPAVHLLNPGRIAVRVGSVHDPDIAHGPRVRGG